MNIWSYFVKKNKRIGFTTSFPVEVVFAAGHFPIDLNNLFLDCDSTQMIHAAELKGFPRTVCGWIKGNYSTALASNLDEVIGITQGDCSNAQSLLDMIAEEGIPVWSFSFPNRRTHEDMDRELRRLEEHYEVDRTDTLKAKARLDEIRRKLLVLDEWTWNQRLVTGKENHLWLVSSSDFNGDPDRFEEELDTFMQEAAKRDPMPAKPRCAFLGVPPIYRDMYDLVRDLGGDVGFNEVQRQFAMPHLAEDIVEQYLLYTYPYTIKERLEDILPQLQQRKVDLVLSYIQSFCHLQIDNILLKKYTGLPFLTLEGDQPEPMDNRALLRLESFFEVHS
ncbi:MAG: 2-hydroxyacyl-CoA dehydratase [Candidatus Cloacimonetes bacterium]|nr:2-hydroxyacyl-CoA dehydratase [Candidatus Cloacimonadota bacterium]